MIVGRSLPRAIAAAKSAGALAGGGTRAPPFELQTSGGGGAAAAAAKAEPGGRKRSSSSNASAATHAQPERAGSTERDGVTTDDMIAGNPRRAMEELSLRAKLEVVRGEVEATLKMHATMARGERTSWLKQIERQNEENAYQVLWKPRHFCLRFACNWLERLRTLQCKTHHPSSGAGEVMLSRVGCVGELLALR